jgi:aryl-alcohol dehydrogenase-like predicted oxidoreductase
VSGQREAPLGDRRLTRVGLGTNRLTDTDDNHAFLRGAVEAGLNFIDTAHLYTDGSSERTIGNALAPFADDLVVATKGGYEPGDGRPDVLRTQLEQSFESLQATTIHLYYLHRVDPQTPLEESLSVLSEFRDAGRIEHVGLSAVTVEQIERGREVVPIAAVQNEYHLGDRSHDEVVDYCEREGLLFVPYFPLRAEPAAVREVAAQRGVAPQQVVVAWLLRRSPAVLPIPGTLSPEHLRENLGALELELTDEEFERIGSPAG